MTFEITLSFTGTDALVDTELVDIFENEYLEYRSISMGGTALACEHFANTPDAAHDMVVCDLGTLSGPISVTAEFEALSSTLPDRTLNTAYAEADPDGDGPEGRVAIGPASDDVEIIEVLALPPLGDAPLELAAGVLGRHGCGARHRSRTGTRLRRTGGRLGFRPRRERALATGALRAVSRLSGSPAWT